MGLNTFKLNEYLINREEGARYYLACSDPESMTMQEVLDLANIEEKKLWNNLSLEYTDTYGDIVLRKMIAQELYPGLREDQILVCSGAADGIFCGLYGLLKHTDHVIVLTPCYQSLLEIPRLAGVKITKVELKPENQWKIDLREIKSRIQDNTKCIIINFPHNPTGQIIESEDLNGLIEICDQNGIWIFSDEVYRLLNHKDPVEPVACIYNRGISLGVMSKAFGMPGVRIGWIACQNTQILKQIDQIKHYTSGCNSGVGEVLSLIAIRNKDKIIKRNSEIVGINLAMLDRFILEFNHLFEWVKPQAGCIGFVRCKQHDTAHFCDSVFQARGIVLLAGSVYDHHRNYFRIGFGKRDMPICLKEFEEYLCQRKSFTSCKKL